MRRKTPFLRKYASIISLMALAAIFAVLAACTGSPAPNPGSPPDDLDLAIREASDYIKKNVPNGTKLAIIDIKSDYPPLSEYAIDTLMENIVNDRLHTVVDRQQLDAIRAELNFQLSGEVDDNSAAALGRMVGAQTIVVGSVSAFGAMHRLTVRALAVEGAQVQGIYNRNIQSGATITSLTNGSPAAAAQRPPNSGNSNAVSPSSPAQPEMTAAPLPVSPDAPGLYANGAYQGQMGLMDAADWIALNARSGGSYAIVLGSDDAGSNISLSYNSQRINVTLKGSGSERKVTYDTPRPPYSLITVGAGVTFTLEEGIALIGLEQRISRSMVRIEGGTFIMNGGSIKDNNLDPNGSDRGGGVNIIKGTFVMNNGIISGNARNNGRGGGVSMAEGVFTMNNGVISGNSSEFGGGGVFVGGGAFTMNGGTISGNYDYRNGGGIFVSSDAVFIKSGSGGIIYGSNAPEGQANRTRGGEPSGHAVFVSGALGKKRNTTARISTALDSRQRGTAGGWE